MSEAFIEIDVNSEVPVARQIEDGVRHLLVCHTLRPGDALPPVRDLAARLGVHFNTVAQAYRVLEQEGWLEVRRRSGTRVLERGKPALNERERGQLADNFSNRFDHLLARFWAAGLNAEQIRHLVNARVTAIAAQGEE